MFLGTHINGLDAKKRVSTPAEFRAEARKEGLEGVFCWVSVDGGYLEGCGQSLMDRYRAKLEARDPFDGEGDDFAQVVLGGARLLKFDATGRVTLPQVFVDAAGLTSDVAFVGLGDKFQVWNPGKREEYVAAARERLQKRRQSGPQPSGEPRDG